jgi:flagellar biosynthesis/type III secretory pathway M-ring protein FliF/YscJ
MIFASIFLTWFTYSKTFNSVWCFYCAILSIMVLWIVNRPQLRLRSAAGS